MFIQIGSVIINLALATFISDEGEIIEIHFIGDAEKIRLSGEEALQFKRIIQGDGQRIAIPQMKIGAIR